MIQSPDTLQVPENTVNTTGTPGRVSVQHTSRPSAPGDRVRRDTPPSGISMLQGLAAPSYKTPSSTVLEVEIRPGGDTRAHVVKLSSDEFDTTQPPGTRQPPENTVNEDGGSGRLSVQHTSHPDEMLPCGTHLITPPTRSSTPQRPIVPSYTSPATHKKSYSPSSCVYVAHPAGDTREQREREVARTGGAVSRNWAVPEERRQRISWVRFLLLKAQLPTFSRLKQVWFPADETTARKPRPICAKITVIHLTARYRRS